MRKPIGTHYQNRLALAVKQYGIAHVARQIKSSKSFYGHISDQHLGNIIKSASTRVSAPMRRRIREGLHTLYGGRKLPPIKVLQKHSDPVVKGPTALAGNNLVVIAKSDGSRVTMTFEQFQRLG